MYLFKYVFNLNRWWDFAQSHDHNEDDKDDNDSSYSVSNPTMAHPKQSLDNLLLIFEITKQWIDETCETQTDKDVGYNLCIDGHWFIGPW